jgi:hypothetical protein
MSEDTKALIAGVREDTVKVAELSVAIGKLRVKIARVNEDGPQLLAMLAETQRELIEAYKEIIRLKAERYRE